MIKYIKNLLIILLLFSSIGNTAFAAVYSVNLSPSQTYYYDPYKIKNNTSGSIFAPFSDSSGRLTSNFSGGSSFSFGAKLDRVYTYGGFTLSNTGYSWITGGYGSCSVSCGGGTQYRFVGCNREDGTPISDSYCSGSTKPPSSQSCNTQACPTSGAYSYGGWSGCSASCGGGTQTRAQYCYYDSCYSPQATSQSCNTQSCIPTCPSGYTWNTTYSACAKATKIALNCYDGSTAAGWYKTYIGRCGEQDGLNWRNTSISTNGYYIAFNQFNKDKYVTCMNYAGTTNLTLCNNIMLCDYGATYIVNTNYCKK